MSRLNNIKNTAGAFALGALCVGLYWPRPTVSQPPLRDLGAPAAPAPARSVPLCPAAVSAAKTCNPACKVTEVCIDGTCCQPAAGTHGTMLAGSIWVAGSLK